MQIVYMGLIIGKLNAEAEAKVKVLSGHTKKSGA
jgi:hypothetical protein